MFWQAKTRGAVPFAHNPWPGLRLFLLLCLLFLQNLRARMFIATIGNVHVPYTNRHN